MSGYTPLFSSLATGTLYGRWPDIGLWPILLSLADKNGIVDVTPAYIAGVTGLAAEEVVACLQRFCEPDPYSRSQIDGGARLALLDEHRDWGWRVINHGRYREKARLAAKSAQEVASGRNRGRLHAKGETAGHRRSPPVTAADRPSDADADANTKEEKPIYRGAAARPAQAGEPPEFSEVRQTFPRRAGSHRWPEALKGCHTRIREGHSWAEFLEGVSRYRAYIEAIGKERTEFVMQAGTFFGPGKHFLEPWDLPDTKADRRLASNLSVVDEFMRRTEAG